MRFARVAILSLVIIAPAKAGVDFSRDVQPILAKHCYDCHGAQKQKNGLRLDARAHALKGGEDHGPPITPGKSAESILIRFTSGADEAMLMPPKGERLSPAELDTLRRWIDEGAVWPDDGIVLNDPLKSHWAFQPISRPRVPEITNRKVQITNPVDAFVVARLEDKGLALSPPADARTLARRLYLDIIGLPPTPEEIEAFERSCIQHPAASIQHLVSRLLASPNHGERWARHWLDVVRFAESDGFEKNQFRPNAWPYRDYVIQAINDNKPFDQFVREQLAGDALGADEATGFLVGGAVDTVRSPDPVLTAQQRADELNEMVSATGSTFLGLTINCARCHNHKFDPISQADYTAMCATFAGVQYGERALKPDDYAQRVAKADSMKRDLAAVDRQLARFEPVAHANKTIVIHPEDETRTEKLRPSGAKRTRYEEGAARGEKGYAGTAKELPTLGDGYWVWVRENAKGNVFSWRPKAAGKFRVWASWGSGYKTHDEDARYVLDADGDPKTVTDQHEIGRADHRKYADGTGEMKSRKLWSGFKDLGVHEFTATSALLLRVGGDEGFPTADVLVLQEEGRATPSRPSSPHVRLPVKRDANTERFAPVEAKFVRFVIEDTTQLQPCIDELEVFTSDDQPRNVALASLGARTSASSNLPGYAIHQVKHLNDGLYGNDHSWISNEKGRGWAQIELAQAQLIDRVIWSRDRDNVPRYEDRVPTRYRIETSLDGDSWQTVATSSDRLDHATKLSVATIARADTLAADEAKEFTHLQSRRAALNKRIAEATAMPMAYAGKFSKPVDIHRFQRGDVTQPREVVLPAVLASVGSKATVPADAPEPQRRLALANWIVDRQNPLTARVIVNRLWHHHFGTGIVDTPSDFGVNGGKPSHPELLDWLASELIDGGWDLRHIDQLILTSSVFCQASSSNSKALALDADNRLLWRFTPRRLEAEALRDTMLAVSGKLDLKLGGPGFDLFEPNDNYVKVYTTKENYGPAEFRRMVYQSKPRVELDSIFGAFDCPDAGQATPKRTVSTTPLQALSLLNSSFALQQSEFFAERVRREAGPDLAIQCDRAFLLAFGRRPNPEAFANATTLIKQFGLAALCRALFNANEFVQVR
jgi:mono/diheme cytochrome c family protein